MLMFKALKNRALLLLWGGQALSSIGDEIYRVALTWFAVGLIGPSTGFLSASIFLSVLIMSLFGGHWADRWDHRKTMITVDVLRFFLVLTPVLLNPWIPISMTELWIVTVIVASLGAFFDPAMQGLLPLHAPDTPTLRAATGMMATTIRLARVVGPALIGFLSPFVSQIHFFTLDAMTFLFSALTVYWIGPTPRQHTQFEKPGRFIESVRAGYQVISGSAGMLYASITKAISAGAWGLAYLLGLAIKVHDMPGSNTQTFGAALAAYGSGNIVSALVLANSPREKPTKILLLGFLWMGSGLVWMGLARSLPELMIAAVYTGAGGPLNDLPFTDVMQNRYSVRQIPTVFRWRIAIETSAYLAFMLIGPALMRGFSSSWVMAGCGMIVMVVGGSGAYRLMRTGA